jgi:protein-S-isoprenylcysteine O-methyltransferase Ste14
MMDSKCMTRWGCGRKIARRTALVTIVLYVLQYLFFPDFVLPIPGESAFILGAIWFVAGFPIWLSGAKEIKKAFPEKRLVTSGIFRYIQHPIYAAFTFFYIPGAVLMTRSILSFLLPFVFYFFFRKYIHVEEEYLEDLFNGEYLGYRERTGRIFPKF